MSYDLFFRARNIGKTVTWDEFAGHFAERPHYEFNEFQAWYSNEDTSVYFSFEYNENDPSDETDDEAHPSLLPVSFNMNYFRPHPFALEAEPEVNSFVKAFDLTVFDPQRSGMGEGEYSAEGFLRGWNAGNEFGYLGIASQDTTARHLTLPAHKIETLWRWNYGREKNQTEIGESIFVPRIFFFNFDGVVKTGVAWIDGIPILLPKVDLLLVPRDRLAPRRLFRSPAKDAVLFHWKQMEPVIKRFRNVPRELQCYELSYRETPADIERLIRQAKSLAEKPEGVRFDQILDQALLDNAMKLER